MPPLVAALFVEPDTIYRQFPGVDCWDETRDARRYDGAAPVVAHPPCARWSVLAGLVHSRGGPAPGADSGCFASALASVERCGGVLEHPRGSSAWRAHGMTRPVYGAWLPTRTGWTTEVCQVAYGHRAEKRTWLYLVGEPAPLRWWHVPMPTARVSEARRARRPPGERMCRKERRQTPRAFAEELLALARGLLRAGAYQAPLW